MLNGKITQDQHAVVNITAVSAVYVIFLILLMILYLGLHLAPVQAGNSIFFNLNSVAGRAAELAFWSSLGVLFAGLGRLAKIMILSPPSPFSIRHFVIFGLKSVFVAWAAVALLGFATGLVLLLSPELEWLAVDNELALASGLIPASFLLGLYGNVAISFFHGLRNGAKREISKLREGGAKEGLSKAWNWLRHNFIKSLWLGDPKEK